MRIESESIIAGQPALAIRKLLRQEKGTLATIMESLHIDPATARQVYQELHAEGYIESWDAPFHAEGDSWQTTMKGNALAHATARKAITRRTAERLVEQFLKRVREVNACDDYVYRIKQVILFGSYLSDSERLGDVDLSLVLEFRLSDAQRRAIQSRERIEHAIGQGKNFRSFMDQVAWPYHEVFTVLKGGSSSLSLHDEQIEQVLSQPIPSKILFDATADKS